MIPFCRRWQNGRGSRFAGFSRFLATLRHYPWCHHVSIRTAQKPTNPHNAIEIDIESAICHANPCLSPMHARPNTENTPRNNTAAVISCAAFHFFAVCSIICGASGNVPSSGTTPAVPHAGHFPFRPAHSHGTFRIFPQHEHANLIVDIVPIPSCRSGKFTHILSAPPS